MIDVFGEGDSGAVVPGITQFTPTIPKFYWDVDSQEQGIKQLAKIVNKCVEYIDDVSEEFEQNSKDIKELQELFKQFMESGFDDYYAKQIEQWFKDNAWNIYKLIAKQVFFGLTDDGYFCAYVPDSWAEVTFDTGAVYGTEQYGRLILRYDADGHGIIDNTDYDGSVVTDIIDSRFKSIAGKGLEFKDNALNVKVADTATFGGVKLKHAVDNDDSDEWAVTSDGVYAYAPSKAETTAQPTEGVFTDVLSGVTLSLQNTTRIGGLVAFGLRVQTNAETTVSAATRIAKVPSWIKGVSSAVCTTGVNTMQVDAIGISCAKSIEPNSDLYFWCVCKYNG